MGYKVFATDEFKSKKSFSVAAEVFDGYARDRRSSVQTSKRFNLGSWFDPAYSCKHSWQTVTRNAESDKFFQVKFDESDIGDEQKRCAKCNAYSLWEQGKLFAYDAIEIEEDRENKPKRSAKR